MPPALPVPRVLDCDAARGQLVAQPVRLRPLLAARPPPGVEHARQVRVERGLRRGRDREHQVEVAEKGDARPASAVDSERASSRRLSSRIPSNRAASAADTFRSSSRPAVNAARTPSSISGRPGSSRALLRVGRERGEQRVDALDGGGGGRERLVGVVERRAVVDRDQRSTAGRAADTPRGDEIGDAGDVPGRLRHLLAAHPEVGAVQPVSGRTAARWPPRSGRSRPRGAGT